MMESKSKSTKIELSQRVKEVSGLLLEGRTRSHILQYGSDVWNISERQIDDYISMAWKNIREVNALDFKDNVSVVINNLWDVYRQARIDNDKKNALVALAQIAKIKGLDQQVINHVIEDKREMVHMSNDELELLLETSNPDEHH